MLPVPCRPRALFPATVRIQIRVRTIHVFGRDSLIVSSTGDVPLPLGVLLEQGDRVNPEVAEMPTGHMVLIWRTYHTRRSMSYLYRCRHTLSTGLLPP
jgi:hypothetical protein